MKIYNYIYFKFYQFFCIINNEMPGFLAMMAMCWLFLINSFTIIGLIVLNNKTFAEQFTKIASISYAIIVLIIHQLYFSNDRKQKIYNDFSKEKKHSMLFGSIGVAAYAFFTFWIFFKFVVPKIGGILS